MSEKNKEYIRFVILLANVKPFTPEIIKEHVAYLKTLDEKGIFVSGGPFIDYKGGMVIVKAANIEEARVIAENDPFIKNGYETFEIRTWLSACKENNYLL